MRKINNIRFSCLIAWLLLSMFYVKGQSGLIAYYEFNGNGADSSGNGFNATISPTPTFGPDRFGYANRALNVQSQSDVAFIPPAVFSNFTTGTISLWVQTANISSSSDYWASPTIFGSDLSGYDDSAFAIETDSGYVGFWGELHNTPGTDSVFQSNLFISDSNWHFIVATINDNNGLCKLYIDTNLIGSFGAGYPLAQRVYCIMGKGTNGGYNTTGLVDDVRINNRVLRRSEIDSLYLNLLPPVTSILNTTANAKISVTAFPNPFNDFTNIVVSGVTEKFDFELYDVTGRMERVIPLLNTTQFQLNRDDLASGVYLYRIVVKAITESGENQIAVGKIVIQ